MRHGQSRARVPRNGGVIIEDPLLNRPARPCANCRAVFRPTQRRRLLCHDCFTYCPRRRRAHLPASAHVEPALTVPQTIGCRVFRGGEKPPSGRLRTLPEGGAPNELASV